MDWILSEVRFYFLSYIFSKVRTRLGRARDMALIKLVQLVGGGFGSSLF